MSRSNETVSWMRTALPVVGLLALQASIPGVCAQACPTPLVPFRGSCAQPDERTCRALCKAESAVCYQALGGQYSCEKFDWVMESELGFTADGRLLEFPVLNRGASDSKTWPLCVPEFPTNGFTNDVSRYTFLPTRVLTGLCDTLGYFSNAEFDAEYTPYTREWRADRLLTETGGFSISAPSQLLQAANLGLPAIRCDTSFTDDISQCTVYEQEAGAKCGGTGEGYIMDRRYCSGRTDVCKPGFTAVPAVTGRFPGKAICECQAPKVLQGFECVLPYEEACTTVRVQDGTDVSPGDNLMKLSRVPDEDTCRRLCAPKLGCKTATYWPARQFCWLKAALYTQSTPSAFAERNGLVTLACEEAPCPA